MTSRRPVGVITGGTHGIGRSAAHLLARDGWAIGVCSRHGVEATAVASELTRTYGVAAVGGTADVSRAADVERFAAQVARELGPPDAVLANAAVPGPVGPLHVVDLDSWAAAVAVDLVGVATTLAVFGRSMAERGGGSLVTMSGGGVGGRGLAPRMSAYTASKAAVVVLTEAVASELVEHGVRVNAIAPGAIATRFMQPVLAAGPGVAGDRLYDQTVARLAAPDSLDGFAALLRLLIEPDGPFITGRVLSARWDDPDELRVQPPSADSSLYQLRRIDGALFGELAQRG